MNFKQESHIRIIKIESKGVISDQKTFMYSLSFIKALTNNVQNNYNFGNCEKMKVHGKKFSRLFQCTIHQISILKLKLWL